MTIVRDMPLASGGEGWVLLSQIEHARVSGELALSWRGFEGNQLVPREEFVEMVFHHDDGWAAWEQRPGVDAASGRPIAFTEMPDDAKFDIWRTSVDAARVLGPLQGAIVAWHFIELPRGTNQWQETECEMDVATKSFITEYSALADRWLADWLTKNSANTEQTARRALEWLQMFDVVSLWLCMAERYEPWAIDLPGGGEIVLTPESPGRICVEPWPFSERQLRLETKGCRVPARRYADAADLAAEPGDCVRLAWDLVPSGAGGPLPS